MFRLRPAVRSTVLVALACALVLVPWRSAKAAFPAANGPIAFARSGSIYTVNGGFVSSALHPGANPVFSPNGITIAFDDGTNLWTMPVASPSSAAMIPGPIAGRPIAGTKPSWSNDNSTLAYVNSGNIYTVSSSGGASTLRVAGTDPAFSPDGTKIAYASGGSINVLTLSTSTSLLIASASGTASSPTWSPSGTQIAFSSTTSPPAQIFVVGSTGSGLFGIIDPTNTDTEPAWSPDGTLIAFATTGGGGGISTVPATGGTPTHVTGTIAADASPDWQDAVPTNSSPPGITPTSPVSVGTPLFASTGTWIGSPTSFQYQWQRSTDGGATWSAITGATSSSYTPVAADVGPSVEVRVTVAATNIVGQSSYVPSLPAGTVAGPAPTNISPPVVSGTPSANPGGFVSATTGTWIGTAPITYTFQWYHCFGHTTGQCVLIPGATSSFYPPNGNDIDTQLNVVVTATNSAGSTFASSAATAYVTGDAPHNHVSPTISGSIEVGSTLTANEGIWTGPGPLTFANQWRICDPQGNDCNSIPGATGLTLILQPSFYGFTIRFMVRARNGAGFGVGISNHTFPILHKTRFGPSNVTLPTIAGPAKLGAILVESDGTWSGEAPITLARAWERCDATGASCVKIPGATGTTYRVKAKDVAATLRLVVTATNDVNTLTVSSDPTDAVLGARKKPKGRKIVGTARDDYLAGGAGDDRIYGLGGNDTILGGAGDDWLYGGDGNDVITGGPGSDHIFGGPGSDTIYAADGERDFIDCGPGLDRAFVDAIDVVKNCEIVTIVAPKT